MTTSSFPWKEKYSVDETQQNHNKKPLQFMVDAPPQQKQNQGAFAQTGNWKTSRRYMEINLQLCTNLFQASHFKRAAEMGDTLFSGLLQLLQA